MVAVCVAISGICCVIDLIIKSKVEDNTIQPQNLKMLPIEIKKAHNAGFAMNLREDKPHVVRCVSCVAMIMALLYQMFLLGCQKRTAEKISGALALGGALSNFYDRMTRGYVVDYISVKTKYKKASSVVFNIADVCILLGSVGLLLFRKGKKD